MKKVIASICVAGLFSSGAVLADDSGFYVGVTAGRSSVPGTIGANAMSKTTDTVAGVLGGYQFTENWGAEVFYTGTGKYSSATASGKGDAYGLDVVGSLPLTDAFLLYAKLGGARTKSTLSNAAPNVGATRSAVTYGLGGQYNFTRFFGLRVGWDHYGAAVATPGIANTNFNANVYSLGAIFNF